MTTPSMRTLPSTEEAGLRLAEEKLRKSEATLRSVLETAPDVILTLDRSGKILFINRTLPHLSVEQVLGTSAFDYIPPEFRERARSECAEVFLTGKKTEYETPGPVNPDGSRFWYLVRVGPIRQDAEIVAVTMLATEITESKRAAERLQQSQKMEAVGQLAAGVAHDFNNLLTVISGWSEYMLVQLPAEDPLRSAVMAIGDAGERAAALTRQLLAFSRRTVLEPKVLDLNVVVKDSEDLLQRLIGEDIQLTTVLEPRIKRVRVDPGQLSQVLMNLAVNARDAMPRGGKLTIQTNSVALETDRARSCPELRPGPYIVLTVSDSGQGMTPEVQARIFEPFFTTKEVGKGTGLGLSVVHGIVKQSGGDVEVFSIRGSGTRFRIYLPAVEEPRSLPAEPKPERECRGSETVLLVEDSDSVRGLAQKVLRSYGYNVLPAGTGEEALALADNYPDSIDLLVTDVVMPGMDGRDLAEALRPHWPWMKVLYVSGYADDDVLRHGLLHEKIAFLQKPYTPRSLARKIREVLDRKK